MPKKVTSLRQTHPWLALKKGAKGEGRRCKYAWEDVTLSSALALPRHLLHIQHHHKHQAIFPSGLCIFFKFNILFNIYINFKMSSALPLALVWGLQHPTHMLWNTSSFCYSTDLSSWPTKKHPHTNTHWCTHYKLSLNGKIRHKINLLESSHRLPLYTWDEIFTCDLLLGPPVQLPRVLREKR